ncbi:alpha/beta fold hydrolase [Sphingomonas immobilis]|jgi:pimeloyl-ACP methyl ester carboxylesterase|uniref:Alpha/beta hydrolase n=1 Tax=Sphingomonas immobilis TaxID=3063997 RepID=A0ABT8ZXW7_9SPHN|nr:alpha/beta hydrolase [Sphingomonas sp. CA1-15]MDO7842057.1 alpha/beta hydrolase [Sphingomonas sp. CA1-15]
MRPPVAIAFLHGGKQGSWIWDEVRAAIALQAGPDAPETLTLDVPGCGTKRGRDVASLALGDVVEELADDLAASGRRLILVGHSQAGTVLPRLAAARRDQVAKLVYLTCSVPEEGQTLAAMLGTGLQGTNDAEIGWPLDPATHSPDQLFAEMFCNDMDDAERDAFLGRLGGDDWPAACAVTDTQWGCAAVRDIPARYVIALRDTILTPPWQERFAARLNAASITRVDAGHQLLQTRPQAVAEILLAEVKDTL